MTFGEAMIAISQGKKVKWKDWDSEDYIFMRKWRDSRVICWCEAFAGKGDDAAYNIVEDDFTEEWELYQEPKKPETVELTLWGYVDKTGYWAGYWYPLGREPDNERYKRTDQTRTITFVEGD